MDANIRAALRAAEAYPTQENKEHLWELYRRYGLRGCSCENMHCPVCGEGCIYLADPRTRIDYIGSTCMACAEHTPLEYHRPPACQCRWCASLTKYVIKAMGENWETPRVKLKLRRKAETDEWVVAWMVRAGPSGKGWRTLESRSYYTNDKEDAQNTLKSMQDRLESKEIRYVRHPSRDDAWTFRVEIGGTPYAIAPEGSAFWEYEGWPDYRDYLEVLHGR